MHFISGLPRSGSTLLAALLRQNPKFVAGMTSPVATLFKAIEDATAMRVETSVFVTEEQRENLLRGIFSIYYQRQQDQVVFDTSRMWCARLGVLGKLFPDAKIICCVREIGWIMDSFERLYKRNAQKPSAIYGYDTAGTVYSRTNSLASGDGVVGYSLDALREACASELSDRLLLIDYECLCKSPQNELAKLYAFIGEEPFAHTFTDLEYHQGEFDRKLGADGLHTISQDVKWTPRDTILPPNLFDRFKNDNFWRVHD